MGAHLINGRFQSDKYPTCPAGKVPLSVADPTAQDLLWEYAQRRRAVDAEFSDDLETALLQTGFVPPLPLVWFQHHSKRLLGCDVVVAKSGGTVLIRPSREVVWKVEKAAQSWFDTTVAAASRVLVLRTSDDAPQRAEVLAGLKEVLAAHVPVGMAPPVLSWDRGGPVADPVTGLSLLPKCSTCEGAGVMRVGGSIAGSCGHWWDDSESRKFEGAA